MKQAVKLFALMAAIVSLASCEGLFPMPGGMVNLEKTEFTLPSEGGIVEVAFIPITSWTASCADSNVTLEPSSGEKSETETILRISVTKNTAPVDRIIKVLLSFESQDLVLTVTQAGAVAGPDTPDNPPPGPDIPDTPDNPVNPDKPSDMEGSTEVVTPGPDIKNEIN